VSEWEKKAERDSGKPGLRARRQPASASCKRVVRFFTSSRLSGGTIERVGDTGSLKLAVARRIGAGHSVLYHRMPWLFEALALARGDGRHARLLKTLARVQLLILDDWGLAPLAPEQRRDLLEIMDDRHGRAATIVTSQLPVDAWHATIGDPIPRAEPAR
jgi:DNA replication protein DnaC